MGKERIKRNDDGKIIYTVKYRLKGNFFWRKIHNVRGDGFVQNLPVLQFVKDDESIIELNILDFEISYPRARWLSICEREGIKKKDLDKK